MVNAVIVIVLLLLIALVLDYFRIPKIIHENFTSYNEKNK